MFLYDKLLKPRQLFLITLYNALGFYGYDRALFVSDVTTVGTIVTTELVQDTKRLASLCVSYLLKFDSASRVQSGKSLLQSVSQRLHLT